MKVRNAISVLLLTMTCTGINVSAQETSSVADTTAIPRLLSLEDCHNLALESNKNILIAQEKIKEAEYLKKAAFTQFLPNISANGAYMYNSKNISLLGADAFLPVGSMMADGSFGFNIDQINNQVSVQEGQLVLLDANGQSFNPKTNPEKILWKEYAYMPKESMEFDIQNIFVGSVGLVQPIFLGGKIRELYRLAKSTEAIANIQYDSKKQDLLLEVDEAYWRVVSVENKCKLATDFCNLLSKLEKDVTALQEEGFATKGDYLKVKVKLNQAEMARTKAENGLRLSKMALYQLCGLNIKGDYILADTDIDKQEVIEDADFTDEELDEIMLARPEIKMLEQMNDMTKSAVNIAISRFLPNIALSANAMASNPNIFNGFKKEFNGMYNVGVVVNIPITHFGEHIYTLNAAKSRQRQAQYQLDEAKEKIELQVNQSTFRIEEANRNLEMAISNIDKAEENVRFAEEAFKEGMIGPTEMMEAQTAWMSAYSEKIDAGIDVKLCKLYLDKAKGQLKR